MNDDSIWGLMFHQNVLKIPVYIRSCCLLSLVSLHSLWPVMEHYIHGTHQLYAMSKLCCVFHLIWWSRI